MELTRQEIEKIVKSVTIPMKQDLSKDLLVGSINWEKFANRIADALYSAQWCECKIPFYSRSGMFVHDNKPVCLACKKWVKLPHKIDPLQVADIIYKHSLSNEDKFNKIMELIRQEPCIKGKSGRGEN